ncbi:MAG TPA: ribonuclease III [Candidatus Baltobacteraceae bacterium]|jgi:ribonuclease-3|nr:ribonuclease III [Candidatus Baltobacteraceae bacterium]
MTGESRRRRLRTLLTKVGVRDADTDVFETAFVHESAVRERIAEHSNERLEFLGDAILGLIAARWLYQKFPDAPEGELALRKAALVNDAALAATAERLEFDQLLVLGTGLARLPQTRRRSTMGDAFEAFIAMLDRVVGFVAVERFVVKEHIEPLKAAMVNLGDAKSLLQEWTQKHFAALPIYHERAEGPPHDRVYHADAIIDEERIAGGSGPSKKAAHRAAASAALEILRLSYDDVPRTNATPIRTQGTPSTAQTKAVKTPKTAKTKTAAKTTVKTAAKRTAEAKKTTRRKRAGGVHRMSQ